MKTRTLGRTGLEVGELSMGGLFISAIGGAREQTIEAVHCGLELGMNYCDTAPGYRDSEEVLGLALEGVDQTVIVSTKLGGRPQPFDPQDKDCLRRSVEESLKLLKRDVIDILMIHEPDRPGEYNWWTDWENVQGPVRDLMDELKEEGVIRFTGLGGTTVYELARIMDCGYFDVVLTAFNYSLLWREATWEVLPTAKKHNMGVVIGSALQQGALSTRSDDKVNSGARWMSRPRRRQYQELYKFLDELGMPLADLAHRFVISNPDVSTVLSGARSAEEVKKNVAAVEQGPLPQDILDRLQEIADMVPFRPFEEPFGLPFWNPDYRGPGRAGR